MTPDQGQDNSVHVGAEEFAANDLSLIFDVEHRRCVDSASQPDSMSAFGRRAWLDLG